MKKLLYVLGLLSATFIMSSAYATDSPYTCFRVLPSDGYPGFVMQNKCKSSISALVEYHDESGGYKKEWFFLNGNGGSQRQGGKYIRLDRAIWAD